MRGCAAAITRAVVAFLDAVLVGCFLSYFRPRPRPGSRCCRDALVPRGQEGEEVLSDDERALGRTGRLGEVLDDGGDIDEELRREANYLKLYGTITETPAEFQNDSCEISLENANQSNNMPTTTPATNCTLLFETNLSEGCISEEHYILSPDLKVEKTRDLPRAESVPCSPFLEKTPFLNNKHTQIDRNGSPFPTPSVLRDDMLTPGTSYASHRGARVSGKRVRTRKQFIYPVLRPIENEERLDEAQSKRQIDNSERLDEGALAKSNAEEKHAAMSLSRWLRPSSTDNESQGDVKCATGGHSYDECSFLAEGPVFVASDLNWDVENPTPRLPKIWNGNCIPNTNTKYKEDKKVTWHATPFEERLMKVLSDAEVRPAK